MSKLLKKKINDFAKTHYQPIPKEKIINAEFSMYNQACHYNSVQSVKYGRSDSVWLVWCGGEDGVVHFINSKNGRFYDETLGYEYDDYRIIRRINPCEYGDIRNILVSTKKSLINTVGDFYEKYRAKKGFYFGI